MFYWTDHGFETKDNAEPVVSTYMETWNDDLELGEGEEQPLPSYYLGCSIEADQ